MGESRLLTCHARSCFRNALRQYEDNNRKAFWPESAVARTKYHLSQVLTDRLGSEATPPQEAVILAQEGKDVLSRLLVYDPALLGVKEEDTGALFDHLQPVFGGRFTGLGLLKYVS